MSSTLCATGLRAKGRNSHGGSLIRQRVTSENRRVAPARPSAAPENTGANEQSLEAVLDRVEESSLVGT